MLRILLIVMNFMQICMQVHVFSPATTVCPLLGDIRYLNSKKLIYLKDI